MSDNTSEKRGPNVAWASAVVALGNSLGVKPIPSQLVNGTVGDWDIWLNNGDGEVTLPSPHELNLPRFDVFATSTKYLAFGSFDPSGGLLAGYSEDRFIDDMRAMIPEGEWPQ
jgi:hypothetical protein